MGERSRAFLLYVVVRPLLFVAWAMVLWGTWIAVNWTWLLVAEGWDGAWRALWPKPGASPWAWLNLLLAGSSVCVWTLVLSAWRARESPGTGRSESGHRAGPSVAPPARPDGSGRR